MASWRALAAALLLALPLALRLDVNPAAADQLLENGSFDQGTSGWDGLTTALCPARTPSQAASLLTPFSGGTVSFSQTVDAKPGGSYSVSGYARRLVGDATLRVRLDWQTGAGSPISSSSTTLTVFTTYSAFQAPASPAIAPASAASVTLTFSASATGTTVSCIDDVVLNGPSPVAPSPTPTQTPTPTLTLTPGPSATRTPTAPAGATATPDPDKEDEASAIVASKSSGGGSGSTSSGSGSNGLQFINGGFEDGLFGWQKFGGELKTVTSPTQSGLRAAAFTGASDTRWAYQTVAVDPASTYEFAGYVRVDGKVEAAYLRISWYESGNGTGTALELTDSTQRLDAGRAYFAYLTTGAVRPPQDAKSARLRIMLAPAGDDYATIYLDDFSFARIPAPGAATNAPSAQPQGAAAGAPETRSSETGAPAENDERTVSARGSTASGGSAAGAPGTTPNARAVTEFGEVATARDEPQTAPDVGPLGLLEPDEEGSISPVVWVAALGIGLAGAGGAIFALRRRT